MTWNAGNAVDWEMVLHSVPDAVSVVDAGHRILWVNRAMARFLGLPAGEVVGRHCFELVHGTGERVSGCPFSRSMEGRETAELELPERGIRARITVDPIREEDGTLAGAIHLISDITRERRGIETQRELSGRLISLMNNIPGAVYRGLRDWSVTFMSAEAWNLTGYAAEEFTGGVVRWKGLIHPDDVGRVASAFRRAVAERSKVLRTEYRIRHRDGSIRWLEDRRQLLYDADGTFDSVDGLLLDITDRKLAEERMAATSEKLHALIESSPLPIVALDPSGAVVLWSRSAELTFGWTEEEVLGRVLPIVPEDKEQEFRSLRERVLRGEKFTDVEIRRRKKDGAPVDVSLSAAPLRDRGGSVTGIMSVLIDITRRKQMEEALARSEEKFLHSQRMEAVGRLAGGIAHDFNNLLTAILGYSDLLLKRMGDAPHRREVEEIRKAGDRAASLTQQLLAFSRKQILDPKVLNLNEVVVDMERMLCRLIGEDIDLIPVLPADLWNVRADPGQFEQVILNLAVNARDAMPEGGTLTLETGNRTIDDEFVRRHPEAEAGEFVMLAIGDTGCGMDRETQEKVFEPFFTTKKEGKGTGLGLATVYGIVKQSNGFLSLDSEIGRGSMFRIYIPRCLSAKDVRPAHEERERGVSPGRETILLVEDEEVVRELARTILAGRGYTVLTAGNGIEGVDVVARHDGPIHLVLTDVVMPRMGGQDMAREIASLRHGLKVLFMTGYADGHLVQDGTLPSGSPILRKPFQVEALLRKVREVLDG